MSNIIIGTNILLQGVTHKMDKKDLLFIGAGIGVILLIKNSIMPTIITPAIENIDSGMDSVADYYVKKEMAWNEFAHNSDTLAERYDNLLIWLGIRDS